MILTSKAKDLFRLFDESYLPEVDTIIWTGGRYSLKSYTTAIFALLALYNKNWSTLYTRFTNSSITDSVKPEVSDKIELLGLEGKVNDTQYQIECGGSRISFKGIKTGSGTQTANLKSLSGFNVFVNDEAEELPDYKTFKKIFYSIRSTEKRNLTILILNPTDKTHWIFEEYFLKRGIDGGSNCVKDNVMYIHTSYLDADVSLMPKNIYNDYERLKIENPREYDNIVLGGWIDSPEGILIPFNSLKFDDLSQLKPEHAQYRFAVIDPADRGGDKYAMPFIYVTFADKQLRCFVKYAICNSEGILSNSEQVINKLSELQIDECIIETNGVGVAAYNDIYRGKKGITKITPVHTTEQKEGKILSNYEFILKYFVFDSNYKSDIQYSMFIRDLTSYKAEGDNKHIKDAIDVLSMAAQVIKLRFAKLIY